MENLIKGKELGTFITTAISIGMSQKENNDGVKSRFVIVTVKNEKALFFGKPRKIPIFEDIFGKEYIDVLMKYAVVNPTKSDTYDVKLEEFRNSEDAKGVMSQLLRWEGAVEEFYPFEKGLCYANKADGTAFTDRNGQQVISSGVTVLCIVNDIRPDQTGKMITHYLEPFSPHTQGSRLERTFYKTPVSSTITNDAGPEQAAFNPNGGQAPVNQQVQTNQQPVGQQTQGAPTAQPGVQPQPNQQPAPAF